MDSGACDIGLPRVTRYYTSVLESIIPFICPYYDKRWRILPCPFSYVRIDKVLCCFVKKMSNMVLSYRCCFSLKVLLLLCDYLPIL